jgi:predicted metal-dependent phosphotriesterase family hydrolase
MSGIAAVGYARTVLGDRPADQLGRVNYHEHLFQVSPLLPGDELDDESRSGAEAAALRSSGTTCMVEATPTALGRDPSAVARISASVGLQVIATSGAHREAHYADQPWLLELTEEELSTRFVRDVLDGLPAHDQPTEAEPAYDPNGRPVRAGVLKAGIGYWQITTFERRVIASVAAAHRVSNAPVMIHLEHGSAAFEVLDLLAADGVDADAVALAHVDRNLDPGLHAELAERGAYLGYDGFARTQRWPDSMVLDCLEAAAGLGAQDRILLGGDVARRSRYLSYGGMPGLSYLDERVLPRLSRLVGESAVQAFTVANPARWLARFPRS